MYSLVYGRYAVRLGISITLVAVNGTVKDNVLATVAMRRHEIYLRESAGRTLRDISDVTVVIIWLIILSKCYVCVKIVKMPG